MQDTKYVCPNCGYEATKPGTCPYCQVDRTENETQNSIVSQDIIRELSILLEKFTEDGVCTLEVFKKIPNEEKKLRDIALSGDGEPTSIINFMEICKDLQLFQSTFDIFVIMLLIAMAISIVIAITRDAGEFVDAT